jgi:hypothetical protein
MRFLLCTETVCKCISMERHNLNCYNALNFNPPSRTMALGSTQPLTEKSTRNLPGGKGRPARKADNFTAICEPIF